MQAKPDGFHAGSYSDPDTITAMVRQHAPGAVRVGLETGQLSNWLTLSLRRRGVPAAMVVGSRPLHRQQYRTAPLAADPDTLDEAQDRQDDRTPEPICA
jgi:hypothetical protein